MNIRKAELKDLKSIINLLLDDKLGSKREDISENDYQFYKSAFSRITQDENQLLIVAENEEEIIASLQLSFIQYLTYRGGLRAQIEAVRVNSKYRGQGIGEEIFNWAIVTAKNKGAHLVQLTTDKRRPEALKFYEKLGFKSSHEGMKLFI